ncbi:MAG: efflux RND transporter periplasmic adaptor subunit [Gammaproteobacteria bacterium]
MRRPVVAASIGAAALLAAAAWWGWTQMSGHDAEAGASVFVTPERRTVAATVLATGILRLRVGGEVRIGAQLSGIVDKLNVVVGSKIHKGDVIARIDARGLEARLAQARAQTVVMEQELKRAEIELARSQRLDRERLVARTDVEDRALAVNEARARLEKARRDAAVVETDLNYAVIRSPITGTVASVSTQEGETVAASFNTPTFATVIEDGALELIALVDETDIGSVAIGNPVTFTVEAYPARDFSGHVERVAPRGTIISGVVNFEVMVRIESPVDLLKPDMTANVSIRTTEREATVLPTAAVHRDDEGRYVYVETDGQIERRPVSAGAREGGFIEIRQGVAATDRVLLRPVPAARPD